MSKKKQKATAKKESNFIQRYIRETLGELRKVSWPTKRETINLSVVVLVVLTGMAAFMGILDSLLTRLVAILVQ